MGVIKNLMLRVGADFSAVTKQAKKASSSMGSMMSAVSKFVYVVEALRKKQAGEEA